MIEDFSGTLSSDLEMQRLTGIALRDKKLVTVLFHSEAPSLVYRVLSNDESYKESIYFYRFKDPEPEVLKKFQIKKLPTTLVMYMDEAAEETEPKSDKNEKVPEGS